MGPAKGQRVTSYDKSWDPSALESLELFLSLEPTDEKNGIDPQQPELNGQPLNEIATLSQKKESRPLVVDEKFQGSTSGSRRARCAAQVRSSVTMSVFRAMMDAVERPQGATRSRSERRCVGVSPCRALGKSNVSSLLNLDPQTL